MRVVSVVLLLFSSLFFSCKDSDDVEEEIAKIPLPATSKYLALGDSYTIGEGIATPGRWPMHLSALLSKENIEVGEPLIIAQTGWTTGDLLTRLRNVNLPNDYGLVSLQIGVNNQFQGRSIAEFRNEFSTLLTLSTNLAQKNPKNVLVLTIPDWGATPFGANRNRTLISQQIKDFNQVIKEEAAKQGIALVDVYNLSLQVTQTPSYLAPDNLHYSSSMYEQWARLALPTAKTLVTD